MTYRAAPVTQRDSSALASSNCRMASIATGLDFDTQGGQTATGAAMRAAQDDQSGGTDSGDARLAWDRGYGQALRVRDGEPWSSALADLRAGRLVHLDVWHATVGGPCLSGSGAYGHTIAVAPERHSDGRWLVADPWCSPPKWSWVAEARLEAGAEEWGRRVYGVTREEPGYPTEGPDPRDPRVLAIVRYVVKRLMTLSRPGRITPIPPGPATSGPQPILYTTTEAHEEGSDVRYIKAEYHLLAAGQPRYGLELVAGDKWTYLDGSPGGTFGAPMLVEVYGLIDGEANAYIGLVQTGAPYQDGVARDTLVMISTTREKVTLPPSGGDSAARDEQWREWLLAGSPGSEGD